MLRKFLYLGVLLWASFLDAKVLDVTYKVKFGLLGELGVSHAHLETNGNRYMISIDAKATGLAKTLSKNRVEKHTSEGFIKNGRYYSKRYHIVVESKGKKSEKEYVVDYQKKRVIKYKKKYKNGKLVSDTKKTLKYFSSDDLLTLYFNFPKLIQKNAKPGTYHFKAIGAEREQGNIKLYIPKDKEMKKYFDHLGDGAHLYFTVVIYQKIFNSNRGELMIASGKDGITQKAVLKDLILFGDLVAERIK